MTAFTATQTGNWNDAATWGGGGYPQTSGDTASIGAFTVTVPAATSIICGAITLTGTGAGSRSQLHISGTLTLAGQMTLAAWNELRINGGGALDTNGNNIEISTHTTNHNRLVFVGTANNRCRFKSTAGGGTVRRAAGNVYCHIDWQYCDFENTGDFGGTSNNLGGNFNYTAGEIINVESCTFTACGEIQLGGVLHLNATLIFKNNDIRDSASATSYCALLIDNNTASVGSGTFDVSGNTVSTTGTEKRFKLQMARLQTVDDCVFSNTRFHFPATQGNTPKLDNSFIHFGNAAAVNIISEGTSGVIEDCHIVMEGNKPHTLDQMTSAFLRNTIEALYTGLYTDDGDHAILHGAINQTYLNNLLLESKSGVFLNALGSAKSMVYTAHHNTLVGNYDSYGALCRNETGGTITGQMHNKSNIIYDRSATAGSLGYNMNGAVLDQITSMDYNCWHNIENKYSGVTSATKTAGVTDGYGMHDITENPQFFDMTRSAANYDLYQGTEVGTVAAAVADMLNRNGYDAATKSQIPANASPRRATDLWAWVRAGYKPTNEALRDAGHDGVTIGAMEMDPALTITAVDSPITDASTGNSMTLAGSATITEVELRSTAGGFTKTVTFSGSGTAWIFNGPNVAAIPEGSSATGVPFDSAYWNNEIYITDGSASDTNSISVTADTGWAVVEVGASPSTAQGSVFEGFSPPPTQYDQVYYETAFDTVVDSSGIYTSDRLSGKTKVAWFNSLSGTWYMYAMDHGGDDQNQIASAITTTITSTITTTI